MQIRNMCVKCNRLATKADTDPTEDGFVIHKIGKGCRKDEKVPEPPAPAVEVETKPHLVVMTEFPEPEKVPVKTRSGQVVHNTGAINGLADALLMAGLVKIQPSA